jgi:branched-chain amino acid aminotransferase
VLRFSDRARSEGFGITLHLDSKTRSEIDEFSTSAFIGVRKDAATGTTTLVVPDSKNVIDSVTASSVCDIASHVYGYSVERRSVPYSEIREFSEVMAAGTAAALVPIKSITMRSKSDKFEFDSGGADESGGEVCTKLLQTLKGIQSGKVEDRFGWLVDVERVPEGWVDGAGGKETQTNGTNVL